MDENDENSEKIRSHETTAIYVNNHREWITIAMTKFLYDLPSLILPCELGILPSEILIFSRHKGVGVFGDIG